ncbi:MAG: hypothetical protein WAX14_16555 [Rhodococcus sp. (in: high G+C Gram-positive bacteria)]|uniref:hypothetical protein n=1 Tax=Rhodococcus sp. TaxID=1831 RepID=UPI003BB6364E
MNWKRRGTAAILAVSALGLITAGCGKSENAAPDAKSNLTAEQSYDRWELKYRSCLQGKGFDLPDQAGQIDFGARQDEFTSASDACIRDIGAAPAVSGDQPAKSRAEIEQDMLGVVRCLRAHGYDVDDPDGTTVHVPDTVTDADLDSCVA